MSSYRIRVLEGSAGFEVAGEWRSLHAAAAYSSAAQHPAFVAAAHEAAIQNRIEPSPELVVICAECDGALVGLWPAFREQRQGTRWLVPPGFGASEEYSGPLLRADHNAPDLCSSLLEAARLSADVLFFTLPSSHPAAASVTQALAFTHRHDVLSPVVSLPPAPDIDDWLRNKSSSFRKGLRYDRKQLEKLGKVRLMTGTGGCRETSRLISWIFDEKSSWLKERNVDQSWIFGDRPKEILKKLFRDDGAGHGVRVFALMSEDTPAAGAICFDGTGSLELFSLVINQDFKRYSPGNLLLKEILELAFAENRELDFRITPEDYKKRWADAQSIFVTYVCSGSLRGLSAVARAEWHTRKVAFRRRGRRILNTLAEIRHSRR